MARRRPSHRRRSSQSLPLSITIGTLAPRTMLSTPGPHPHIYRGATAGPIPTYSSTPRRTPPSRPHSPFALPIIRSIQTRSPSLLTAQPSTRGDSAARPLCTRLHTRLHTELRTQLMLRTTPMPTTTSRVVSRVEPTHSTTYLTARWRQPNARPSTRIATSHWPNTPQPDSFWPSRRLSRRHSRRLITRMMLISTRFRIA